MTGPLGDTIAAVATPPGRGGIGIVRVSGPAASRIAGAVIGAVPVPRLATLADFLDGDGSTIDRGLALYFGAPNSFTGEDVLELHGHGGPMVMDRLLERVCGLGAQLARPGEFTERAFLNDKIDLAQAEAVADLIDSASRRAARSAMRSLAGEFSAHVAAIDSALLEVRVHVEAAIDFADEEIDCLADADLGGRMVAVTNQIAALQAECRQGQVLREGFDVVIAGPPNAGKSSLLNRLLAENRAIVTAVPGTTRDPILADIEIEGIPVRLTDTAGLREGGDAVEAIGVERTKAAMANADLVLAVADDSVSASASNVPVERCLVVRNKVDLSGTPAGAGARGEICVSALTGAGLDALRRAIVAAAGEPGEGAFVARKRHLDALAAALRHAADARRRIAEGYGDLAAEELRHAQHQLGLIVGITNADDLLGEIFRGFCVGK